MKTRQLILAAVAGLLSATPVWAANTSYEGSLWTDLIALREQLTAQPQAAAPAGQGRHATEEVERKGAQMAVEQEPTRLNRLDPGPNASIYEELAKRHGNAGRS
jgi:hypothetical protein